MLEALTRRSLAPLAGAIVAVAFLVAPAVAASETVEITGTLEPSQLTIEAGTTVTWHNSDDQRHRVRSTEGPVRLDSENLHPGESFSYTFTIEGSYPYYDHRDRDDSAYFGMIVVGATGAVAEGPLPDSGSVSIIDKSFRPGSIAVATGGTVEWSNDDGEAHTVTATDQAFDSGIMNGGGSFSQTFAEPGSYAYFCLIHPEMRGTITVSDPVDEPPPGDALGVESDTAATIAGPDLGDALGALAGEAAATVSTIDRSFQPDAIEVAVGEAVTWANDDTEGHTVTAVDGTFNSGIMTVGDEYSVNFDAAGTFDYFCAIHPEMTGSVTVSEPVR